MINLVSQYISNEFTETGEAFGRIEFGNVAHTELLGYMEKFAAMSADSSADYTPSMRVVSPKGVFSIEAGNGKLYLSDTNDPNLSSIETSPVEALFIITGLEALPGDQSSDQISEKSFAKKFLYPSLVFLLVAGTVAAIGHRLLTPTDPLFPPVTIPVIEDGGQIAELESQYAGTFTTGKKEGDRLITLSKGGIVDFLEVNFSSEEQRYFLVKRASRNYAFGSEGGGFFAIADKVHVITLLSPDIIEYYEGRYKRIPGTVEAIFE